MGAHVGQGSEFAVLVAEHDGRLPAKVGGEEVAGLGDLVAGADPDPAVAPYALLFGLERVVAVRGGGQGSMRVDRIHRSSLSRALMIRTIC